MENSRPLRLEIFCRLRIKNLSPRKIAKSGLAFVNSEPPMPWELRDAHAIGGSIPRWQREFLRPVTRGVGDMPMATGVARKSPWYGSLPFWRMPTGKSKPHANLASRIGNPQRLISRRRAGSQFETIRFRAQVSSMGDRSRGNLIVRLSRLVLKFRRFPYGFGPLGIESGEA